LFPGRAEANAHLDQDHHPFFLIDNDEDSAWGYDPDGEPAWVRLPLSTVEGATQVRLRIKTRKTSRGYPKELTFTALPGKQTMAKTLAMTDDWQEITLDLATAKIDEKLPSSTPSSAPTSAPKEIVVNKLELKFSGAQRPKEDEEEFDDWREYAEITEIEVYVTGLTKENPAFEKSKLDNILVWEKARNADLNVKGIPLPMAAEYKSYIVDDNPKGLIDERTEEDEEDEDYEDSGPEELIYDKAFKALQRYIPSQGKESIARAQKALESDREKLTVLQVASLSMKPYVIPEKADRATEAPSEVYEYTDGSGEFFVPGFDFGTLLVKDQLTITDSKAKKAPDDCTKTEQVLFWRRPEINNELIFETCLSFESREGEYLVRVREVLEYDDKGRALLWVTPYTIHWFDWKDTEKGGILAGVIRLTATSITRFIDASTEEPALTDDKPWLVLSSSKPLFDAEAEKTSAELKDKLIAAGFTEAESFDSRRAKNLSCCFIVVVAGRYKTKPEAQAALKKVKAQGFDAYTKQGW
jgi:hypothetical protein